MTMEDTTTCDAGATTNCGTAILALDLGKFKSAACVYDPATGAHRYETVATTPSAVHDLLVEAAPATLVIEACSACGWVHELGQTLGIDVRVANTNDEAWKWKRVKPLDEGAFIVVVIAVGCSSHRAAKPPCR